MNKMPHLHFIVCLVCFLVLPGCYNKGGFEKDTDSGSEDMDTTIGSEVTSDSDSDSATDSALHQDSSTSEFDSLSDTSDSETSGNQNGTDSMTDSETAALSPVFSFENVVTTVDCMAPSDVIAVHVRWDLRVENGDGDEVVVQNATLSVVTDDNSMRIQNIVVSPISGTLNNGVGVQHFQKIDADSIWMDACDVFCPDTIYLCDENGDNCTTSKSDYSAGNFTLTLSLEMSGEEFEATHIWYTELQCLY